MSLTNEQREALVQHFKRINRMHAGPQYWLVLHRDNRPDVRRWLPFDLLDVSAQDIEVMVDEATQLLLDATSAVSGDRPNQAHMLTKDGLALFELRLVDERRVALALGHLRDHHDLLPEHAKAPS